ncbi:hypothetical protein KSZ_15300 [Dictyobacter formicarum]|uniref:Uncharacterized protein n=1 Tax=Dictyobacter formicarum TaxID=2778368 RepID=A0ABQ3VCL0_9CHLR|nr:hypothetical protein KSZ_15300 [Dictyobacter formicarum]
MVHSCYINALKGGKDDNFKLYNYTLRSFWACVSDRGVGVRPEVSASYRYHHSPISPCDDAETGMLCALRQYRCHYVARSLIDGPLLHLPPVVFL